MTINFTREKLINQESDARLKQFDFLLAWQSGQILYERATALAESSK